MCIKTKRSRSRKNVPKEIPDVVLKLHIIRYVIILKKFSLFVKNNNLACIHIPIGNLTYFGTFIHTCVI